MSDRYGYVAQLVVHRSNKPAVRGSIPRRTIFLLTFHFFPVALRQERVETVVDFFHPLFFKGDSGAAILAWSYSHDATRENAVLGFIDPSQVRYGG